MPYFVNIKYQRQFFTTFECQTKIIDDDDDDNDDEPTIVFVVDYFSRNYYDDLDLVFRLVKKEIEGLKCSGLYKVLYKIDFDDIEIETIYVADTDKIIKSLQEDEVSKYKMKRFTVPISRHKRKMSAKSSRNVLSDEPYLKKVKINE
jgi:hypothetical protein